MVLVHVQQPDRQRQRDQVVAIEPPNLLLSVRHVCSGSKNSKHGMNNAVLRKHNVVNNKG